jgi:outer membrane protein assembly factor BamB
VIDNSAPAIGADGTIYAASDDYSLYAIRPNGTKRWTFATGSDIHSALAIGADGTVYVGSGDNNLYAVGVAPPPLAKAAAVVSKSPVWPMFHHDRAHTGRSEFSTSANPGILKWTFAIGGSVAADPVIGVDGTIYVGSQDYKFYA